MIRRTALVVATVAPVVAAQPRVADLVTSQGTSYCFMRRTFGLLCPVCGMTHAMIDLVHGSFVEATRANALIWLYVALVIIGWISVLGINPRGWPRPNMRRTLEANFGWLVLGGVAAFTLLRNL